MLVNGVGCHESTNQSNQRMFGFRFALMRNRKRKPFLPSRCAQMKTPDQIAADKRHRALSLSTNRKPPTQVQKAFIIAPRSTQMIDWRKRT